MEVESEIYKTPDSELSDESRPSKNGTKLTAKTLYKLLFVSYFFGLGPLIFINGLYDFATGSDSIITFNQQQLTGLPGFIGTIIFIPIISILFAFFNWLFMLLGLWVYSLFKGPLKLTYKQ